MSIIKQLKSLSSDEILTLLNDVEIYQEEIINFHTINNYNIFKKNVFENKTINKLKKPIKTIIIDIMEQYNQLKEEAENVEEEAEEVEEQQPEEEEEQPEEEEEEAEEVEEGAEDEEEKLMKLLMEQQKETLRKMKELKRKKFLKDNPPPPPIKQQILSKFKYKFSENELKEFTELLDKLKEPPQKSKTYQANPERNKKYDERDKSKDYICPYDNFRRGTLEGFKKHINEYCGGCKRNPNHKLHHKFTDAEKKKNEGIIKDVLEGKYTNYKFQ